MFSYQITVCNSKPSCMAILPFFVFQLNKNLDVKNATSIVASIKTTLPIRNITVQQLLQGRRQLVGPIQGMEGLVVIKVGLGGQAGDSRYYQS